LTHIQASQGLLEGPMNFKAMSRVKQELLEKDLPTKPLYDRI